MPSNTKKKYGNGPTAYGKIGSRITSILRLFLKDCIEFLITLKNVHSSGISRFSFSYSEYGGCSTDLEMFRILRGLILLWLLLIVGMFFESEATEAISIKLRITTHGSNVYLRWDESDISDEKSYHVYRKELNNKKTFYLLVILDNEVKRFAITHHPKGSFEYIINACSLDCLKINESFSHRVDVQYPPDDKFAK